MGNVTIFISWIGHVQDEPGNLISNIKEVIKNYQGISKGLSEQPERYPTGQIQDNLSFKKKRTNNCYLLKPYQLC